MGFSIESLKRSSPLHDPKVPDYPNPPFRPQRQPMPGLTSEMSPAPDHGEKSYKGAGRLQGRKAATAYGARNPAGKLPFSGGTWRKHGRWDLTIAFRDLGAGGSP
jgi:hypothetical protein